MWQCTGAVQSSLGALPGWFRVPHLDPVHTRCSADAQFDSGHKIQDCGEGAARDVYRDVGKAEAKGHIGQRSRGVIDVVVAPGEVGADEELGEQHGAVARDYDNDSGVRRVPRRLCA